jgi:hypothetical protein
MEVICSSETSVTLNGLHGVVSQNMILSYAYGSENKALNRSERTTETAQMRFSMPV